MAASSASHPASRKPRATRSWECSTKAAPRSSSSTPRASTPTGAGNSTATWSAKPWRRSPAWTSRCCSLKRAVGKAATMWRYGAWRKRRRLASASSTRSIGWPPRSGCSRSSPRWRPNIRSRRSFRCPPSRTSLWPTSRASLPSACRKRRPCSQPTRSRIGRWISLSPRSCARKPPAVLAPNSPTRPRWSWNGSPPESARRSSTRYYTWSGKRKNASPSASGGQCSNPSARTRAATSKF